MTKTKTRPRPTDDAEYRETWDRLVEIRKQHAAAEQRALDYEMAHGTNRSDERDLQDSARQVLDVGGVAVAAPEKTLAELQRDAAVFKEALVIQERRFGEISRSVSAKIIDQVRPDHMKLVGAIVGGLTELQCALQAEVDFRKELSDDGVDASALVVVVTRDRPSIIQDGLHVDIDQFCQRFEKHGYDI